MPNPAANPGQHFISEGLKPLTETVIPSSFAIGAPLLPARFLWRNETLCIEAILEQWKETSPCRHGSGERYVRKHWFRLRLVSGEEMTVYFERQLRFHGQGRTRWWLFSKSSGS
jgi:phosphoribosylglycinamide formyltransferase-1